MALGTTNSSSTVHFASPRKVRARGDSIMSVNLTPAIDITFNLLIFFVVATTFKATEGILHSTVPTEAGVLDTTPLPISPIKVRVRQLGDGPSDYSISIDNWRQAPAGFVDLTIVLEELQGRPGFDHDTPVIIFAADDVKWDHVVNCFNAIRRVNLRREGQRTFENISFAASAE